MTASDASETNATRPIRNGEELAAARLQLLRDTQYRLAIRVPQLLPDAFTSADELTELRRIACAGRRAEIRVLLHDPAAALREDHRLIALAQRLSSVLHIRRPVEDVDLDWASSCVLGDDGGYLFLPISDRPEGRAARLDRPAQAPLRRHFDEVWERSVRASELLTLNF